VAQPLTAPFKLTMSSTTFSDLLKRMFDILFSITALLLLSPLYALIAIAIRRNTPGPAIYRGARMGRGGKIFNILKFRTMYETAESYKGPRVTAQDDPRVTPVGKWLRDTKLNELPQFWNVLKGEMSLVGPRPEDPAIAKTWPREVWNEVLSVRPGISSPASVLYRNEEKMLFTGNVLQKYMHELGPDKMRLDQLYVRYRSFWLDLDILFWTILVLVPKIGSYSPPEELLFVGPVTRLIRRHMRWLSIDLVVTFAAIGITGTIWRAYGPLNVGWPKAIAMAAGFALLFGLTNSLLGVNRITWSKATFAEVFDLIPAWLLATTIAIWANQSLGLFPIEIMLVGSSLALAGFIFARYRSRMVTAFLSRLIRLWGKDEALRERALIIGAGPTARLAAWLLEISPNTDKFWLVGFVDGDLLKQGMRIYGAHVVGTCKDLPMLVKKHDVGIVILADQKIPLKDYQAVLNYCDRSAVKLVVLPDILTRLSELISIPNGSTEPVPALDAATLMIPVTGNAEADLDDARCVHCLVRQAYCDGNLRGNDSRGD
jgi:lipopolysaccharide/colanic/teichoic acid biosynthesis glycosyltransferase